MFLLIKTNPVTNLLIIKGKNHYLLLKGMCIGIGDNSHNQRGNQQPSINNVFYNENNNYETFIQ